MFVYNSPGTESALPLETRFWTSVLSSIFSMDRLLGIIRMFLNRWAPYSFVLNNIMDSFASLCFFFLLHQSPHSMLLWVWVMMLGGKRESASRCFWLQTSPRCVMMSVQEAGKYVPHTIWIFTYNCILLSMHCILSICRTVHMQHFK